MYRTDKQFMTNPATAPSRVYIGGLAKTIVASDLEEKFAKHGKILGLVLQMGFAFIQFENEAQAQAAINNENNAMLHGRKICVRHALDKTQKNAANIPPPNWRQPPQNFLNRPKPMNLNENPPPGEAPANEPPPPIDNEADKMGDGPPPMDEMPIGPPMGELPPRTRKRRVRSRERFPPKKNDDFYSNNYNKPPVMEQPERNDCEIIVVSKQLTKYAEYIEQRLKNLGLIVDLLFPNEDVPIGRVLANISSRGCLYAILVMPQNEEHRSLTLNILHGNPQEHRNMPIEDALILITRNFDAYMRGDKLAMEAVGGSGGNISDRHPSSIQLLLNLLAENRQLTSVQYDRLLKYLQERREAQFNHEVEEGVDQTSQESNSKQTELQNRIMNILNKAGGGGNVLESVVAVQEEPAAAAPPPLLKDPSVQKALDSLLGGEMFQNIGAAL